MRQFIRPKVVISKCIEFDHCRYDGSMIPSDFVKALKPHVDFSPVCAEMEVGLGVPRDTVRIVSVNGEIRLMQPATNLDVTDKMRDFHKQLPVLLAGDRWIHSQVSLALLRHEGYQGLFGCSQVGSNI